MNIEAQIKKKTTSLEQLRMTYAIPSLEQQNYNMETEKILENSKKISEKKF